MDDSVDKKLAARYKDVFDNYRDKGAAEGWALLQQKRRKKKPVPYYWLSGAAALLLLAFGLGWYFVDGNRVEEMVNGKVDSSEWGLGSSESGVKNGESQVESNELKVGSVQSGVENQQSKTHQSKKERQLLAEKTASKAGENIEPILTAKKPDADMFFLSAKSTRPAIEITFADANVEQGNLLADPLAKLFAQEKSPVKPAPISSSAKKEIKDHASRNVLALSVFAGSQVNYGKENTRKNARPTGGLQAELALGKHFSVGLGAGIADYQLAYDDGLPALAGNRNSASAATQSSVASVRNTASTGKRTPSFVQNTSVSAPASSANNITSSFVTYRFVSASSIELNRITARFTAIEIPLAFSWRALTGKTGLSLTAAVNSSWMIREAYVADLSIQNFNGTETPVNSQRNENRFTAFTPFSSLQFSLGLQPGGQQSRLSVEPFARFPLQNQGLEQLRYGAAGLNLKFRLNNTNKK